MNSIEYRDKMMILRSLAGTTRNQLYSKWDKVVESKDLHSSEGELMLKLIGGISNDFNILIGRICLLEEKIVDVEMINNLSGELNDC